MNKSMRINHFYDPVTGENLDEDSDNYFNKNYQLIQEDDNVINNPRLFEDAKDLHSKELYFFILWNNFKDKHELNEKYDTFDTMEKFLYMFINENLEYIKKNELINELTLFLNYLLDIGEISFTFCNLWTIKIIS